MAKPQIKVNFDKTRQITEGMRAAASMRVMAGVPAAKGLRTEEDGQAGINNAGLMFIHEYGAPEANIPARPVVHPAVASIRKEIIQALRSAGLAALEGRVKKVEQIYNALGNTAQNAMRKRITDGPFIPLSPRTIAARRAKGRKGTKPLIDTGQLRRALTYVIRKI